MNSQPIEYGINVFSKWNDYQSRDRRAEFWFGLLLLYLSYCLVFLCLDIFLGPLIPQAHLVIKQDLLETITFLVLIPFFLSLQTRRLHDLGYSGWWILLQFIPFVPAFFLVLFCFKGSTLTNEYGEPTIQDDETG